jgi:hypothetical protein
MISIPRSAWPVPLLLALSGCGGSSPGPTEPSPPTSFLSGTWTGTVTIQVNPGDPNAPPPSSGPMTWTFEVMPQTNLQSFRTTVRSDHAWLMITTTATTALTPGNSPPAQISTQGEFTSPRGCRGTFGSVGTVHTALIQAAFTGTDCQQATFIGQLVLTRYQLSPNPVRRQIEQPDLPPLAIRPRLQQAAKSPACRLVAHAARPRPSRHLPSAQRWRQ